MSSRKDLRNNRTSGFHIPMSDADSAGYGGEKLPEVPAAPVMPPLSAAARLKEENAALQQELEDLRQQLQSRTSALSVHDGTLLVHDFQFTSKGLIAPSTIDQETWEQVGNLLFKLEGSIQWLIGDWLVYGVDLKYGDIPRIAASLGRDEKTLRNYMTVSREVDMSRRRDNLSFGHHEAVASLQPYKQTQALDYASQKGLSVADFRKWLRGDTTPDLPQLTARDEDARTAQIHDIYWSDVSAFVKDKNAIASLPREHREEFAKRVQWLSDYYADLAKFARKGKK